MATKSFQTCIEYGDQSTFSTSTTFTPFANVTEVKPPSLSCEDIDVTCLDSPDEMKVVIPGLGDAGDSTFKLQWANSQSTTVYSLFRQPKGFRITYADAPYPSGSKLRFNGFLKGIEGESITKDGIIEATVTIRVVGKPDFQAKP